MPSLLRSEAMSLVQLYIPSEVAHPTITELGELQRIEFKDVRRPGSLGGTAADMNARARSSTPTSTLSSGRSSTRSAGSTK